jgi:hypothetical protein
LLKVYIYGYLNRVQSSRRLKRECQRYVELMWLTGRLAPDFKTIAEFRRGNGDGIRNVCRRFVNICRDLRLFTHAAVAIDGSKFKAVNSRGENVTPNKIERRQEQIEKSIQRYMDALETADRTQPDEVETKTRGRRSTFPTRILRPVYDLRLFPADVCCWPSPRGFWPAYRRYVRFLDMTTPSL